MADQILITDPEAVKTIEKYAEQKGISKAEAGARLIKTARGRINAVRKYASAHTAPKTPRKPRVAKKVEAQPPKRRGRPPGSKNKPKVPEAAPQAALPETPAKVEEAFKAAVVG